ncbi:MAG: hypothetical protein QXM31_01765 [Candidatus Woesearchaeota archaeon]
MRKLALIALFCILLNITSVLAVDCIDSDKDDDIKKTIDEKGSVTYGLTEKFDECVSGKDGYHVSTGRFVREYYCTKVSDVLQRKYEDIDCERYGFTRCEEGRCIGKNTTATYTGTSSTTTGPTCGNHKLDAGEQCDPPDKICYDNDGNIGQCTRPNAQGFGGCQCKTLASASTQTAQQTTTVQHNVTTTTQPPTTQAPAAQPQPAQQPAPTEQTPSAPEERSPLPTENFDDSKGISVTRGIANAVKRFFRWIGSWFG